ncbi:MAG TPA: hypothetical protein PKL31_16825 [Fulvivirga sp.]|nr:hypothetical protein [Fulvivirga sp.]
MLTILLYSCSDEEVNEVYSDIPAIELQSIEFIDASGIQDTIKVIISYTDGDGNLGIAPRETTAPFNQRNYFSNKTGDLFDFETESVDDLMTISDAQVIDTLPPFSGDYICYNWDTRPELYLNDGSQLQDTVYFQFNPYFYNYIVDFYVDDGSGFKIFDWRREIDCSQNYNGRFPKIGDRDEVQTITEGAFIVKKFYNTGTIEYNLVGSGFKPIFKGKSIKLRLQIIDRALNKSNRIETAELSF